MHKSLLLILITSFALTACVGANQQAVVTGIKQQLEPERQAWNKAGAVIGQKCAPKLTSSATASKAGVEWLACGQKLYIATVRPYALYPQIFDRQMARIAGLKQGLAKGEIEPEEMKNYIDLSFKKYEQEIDAQLAMDYGSNLQEAAQLDEMQRQRMATGLQNLAAQQQMQDYQNQQLMLQQQPHRLQTNCRFYGNMMSCN